MTFQTEETFPGKSLLTISWMHHKIQSCHVSMWFAVMLDYYEDTTRSGWWSWKQFGHRRTAMLSHKLLCWVRSFTTHLSQNTFDQLYLDIFRHAFGGSTLHSAIESNLDYSENQGHFSKKYIWAFAATTIFHHCTVLSLQNLYLVRTRKKAAGETRSFPMFLSLTRNVPALIFDDSSSKKCPVYVLLNSCWRWGCGCSFASINVLHLSTFCFQDDVIKRDKR